MTWETVGEHASFLGEGPLWHPSLKKLFWFDIIGNKLFCDDGRVWEFDEHVSAAGWVSETEFLIASETQLMRFNIETKEKTRLVDLEADDPLTRSNDGRADPWGGFWIGTMGKKAQKDLGAIYRYYHGELRQLFAPISISNAICFAPDKSTAYFTDTAHKRVLRVPLRQRDGWPEGAPRTFLDLNHSGENPDGAVVCRDASVLIALWGSSCIARFAPDGAELGRYSFPTAHISCPAMGGPHLKTLYATSAQQDMTYDDLASQPLAGHTFKVETDLNGVPEYQVKL